MWLTAALSSGYLAAVPAAVDLVGRVGRLKFLKPLYDALAGNPDTFLLAQECFDRKAAAGTIRLRLPSSAPASARWLAVPCPPAGTGNPRSRP